MATNISAPKKVTFGIVNRSTFFYPPNYQYPGSPSKKVLTDAQAKTIAEAIAFQIQNHFSPLWPSSVEASCVFVPETNLGVFNNPNVWPVIIVDNLPGFYAEHSLQGDIYWEGDVDPSYTANIPVIKGRPFAFCASGFLVEGFDPPTCDGQVLEDPFVGVPAHFCPETGLIDPAISKEVSHEICEMLSDSSVITGNFSPPFKFCVMSPSYIDPGIPETSEGAPFVAVVGIREAADPVSGNTYSITVNKQVVDLSNFPTEAWFSTHYWAYLHPDADWQNFPGGVITGALQPPAGTKWDYMGLATGPWEITDGYMVFNVISTSGNGPLINPPNWQNPSVTPQCAGSAPPLPPSYKRVALSLPGFGYGNAYAFATPPHSLGSPMRSARLRQLGREAGLASCPLPEQIFSGSLPYFKRT